MFVTGVIRSFRNPNGAFFNSIRLCSLNAYQTESLSPDTHEKRLKVAIIGVPNAGKSTFINNLMDRKVCATSSKVHTTRSKCKAIFTDDDTQIIFLDTPGLVNLKEIKRFNLGRPFSKDCKSSLLEADIIGVIHDASNVHTRERLDLKIIHLLGEHRKKPSFLVLNKIDLLKSKRKLLDITRLLTDNCLNGELMPGCKPVVPDPNGNKGWPYFHDIFMVSASTGSGLTELRNHLIQKAQPGKWLFPANVWSDQKPEDIILNTVKGKFLDFLQQEIPYSLQITMEYFDIGNNGGIKSSVLVKCPTKRIANLIAGAGDGRLRLIIEGVQSDLQHTFQNFVRLNIVLVAPDEEKKA